jgi:hypothetical protein
MLTPEAAAAISTASRPGHVRIAIAPPAWKLAWLGKAGHSGRGISHKRHKKEQRNSRLCSFHPSLCLLWLISLPQVKQEIRRRWNDTQLANHSDDLSPVQCRVIDHMLHLAGKGQRARIAVKELESQLRRQA